MVAEVSGGRQVVNQEGLPEEPLKAPRAPPLPCWHSYPGHLPPPGLRRDGRTSSCCSEGPGSVGVGVGVCGGGQPEQGPELLGC